MIVSVAVPDFPAFIVKLVVEAVMEKSGVTRGEMPAGCRFGGPPASYAPMSITGYIFPVALWIRGFDAMSRSGRFGAELSPASIAGEPVASRKLLILWFTNFGSAEIFPEVSV